MSEQKDQNEAACGGSALTAELGADLTIPDFLRNPINLVAEKDAEIARLRTLAKDAYDAWQHDRDMRVGKLLLAMMDTKFSATYRPDLVPNADVTGLAPRKDEQ